jgi:hypothetical protein
MHEGTKSNKLAYESQEVIQRLTFRPPQEKRWLCLIREKCEQVSIICKSLGYSQASPTLFLNRDREHLLGSIVK